MAKDKQESRNYTEQDEAKAISHTKKAPKLRKSKSKELEEELKKVKEQNSEIKESLLRKMADFENYKKRTEREFTDLISNANTNFIKDILHILDELELSLKASKENTDYNSFYEGVNLIFTKFLDLLKQKGLKPIESVGEEFDVDMHEAVMQKEEKGTPSNIIIEEYQKGYLFNGRVIRHSKVVVNK